MDAVGGALSVDHQPIAGDVAAFGDREARGSPGTRKWTGSSCIRRRELLLGIEFLEPELLADGQHVPVVEIGGARRTKRTAQSRGRFFNLADRLLEGVAL
jgi:hypothetical protein